MTASCSLEGEEGWNWLQRLRELERDVADLDDLLHQVTIQLRPMQTQCANNSLCFWHLPSPRKGRSDVGWKLQQQGRAGVAVESRARRRVLQRNSWCPGETLTIQQHQGLQGSWRIRDTDRDTRCSLLALFWHYFIWISRSNAYPNQRGGPSFFPVLQTRNPPSFEVPFAPKSCTPPPPLQNFGWVR